MSQSAPGWYQDHDDPRLARWWDGERWTEHTLVLDEQDWSTEPDPPAALAGEAAVEAAIPLGYEEDIYAPIRDPWGDEAASPATTTAAWGATAAATPTTVAEPSWAANGGTGWSDEPYDHTAGRGGFVDGLPMWAKVGLPIGVLLVVVLAFAAFGLGGGDGDGDQVGTDASSTTSTSRANLGDAADAALARAGTGPFTRSTFTTLIQLACTAAENDDAAALTQRVTQLGYDTATLAKLMDGLDVGTEAYCPDDMAGAPTLLAEVETAAGTGAAVTSSTTGVTVGETTTSTTTKRNTTSTTKKPNTSTTVKPSTTTTTAPPPSSTTTTTPPPSSTTTTDCTPNCEG